MTLIGRRHNVDELLDIVTSDTVPLAIVTGPPGVGRSAVLGELRDALGERGVQTFSTGFYRDDRALSTETALAANEVTGIGTRPMSTTTLYPIPLSILGSVVGAHRSSAIATRAARALADFVRERDCTVLLVDDVQWIGLDLIAVAEALVHRFAGTPFTCVCAARTPISSDTSVAAAASLEALTRLRADGLVQMVHLGKLSTTDVAKLAAEVIQAKPEPGLVDRIQQLGRGIPAALLAAIDAYQRADSIQVVDRHAYLVRPGRLASLPLRHNLLAPIGRVGDRGWAVAKAIAVFHPLGAAVPDLVRRALGLSEAETHQIMKRLCAEGILRFRPTEGICQFRVPLVADTLVKQCGPYERRQLAYLAASAVSSGEAHCADPRYLTDQLANAGTLLDPRHTVDELLARAREVVLDDGERADRWLQAATDLTTDRESRAQILAAQTTARLANNDCQGALACSTSLLADYADVLSSDQLLETQILHIRSLDSIGATDALERIISGEARPFPDKKPHPVTRATALMYLGRWRAAYDMLHATTKDWSSTGAGAVLGRLLLSISGLFVGCPGEFERDVAARETWPPENVGWYRYEFAAAQVRALLVLGDQHRAEKLLIAEKLPAEGIRPLDQAWLAALNGQADRALELHRATVAYGMAFGHDRSGVGADHVIAMILYARGRLTQARETLSAARSTRPVMPHLLDGVEALVDRALGEQGRAERRLRHSLAVAAEQGVFVETDALWLQLTELAMAADNLTWARIYRTEIERVAARMGTDLAVLRRLMATALVDRDPVAAEQAVKLAKERDQPLELAHVIGKVVTYGVGDPSLLPEAYDLLGPLDALLYRSRVRDLMRQHDITVPGRRTTLAENERLLAVLVSQGLGNKELATVLRATEKSIEGRLSRLFSRTGYRSRVELAAAILNGEFGE